MRRLVQVLAGVGLLAHVSNAADAPVDCTRIDDDKARLACYDSASGRQAKPGLAATTSAMTDAPSAGNVAAKDSTTGSVGQGERNFGLSAKQQQNALQAPDSITATVVSVGPASHVGRWVVTLDNGQVWEQRETTADARRPRPGDSVTIQSASLGSFLLTSRRGASRVRRIQ